MADDQFVTLIRSASEGRRGGRWHLREDDQRLSTRFTVLLDALQIVLNELDHALEKRNLGYCRWADEFVIVVRSERAAQHVMQGTIRYLEEELGIRVNQEKSQVAPIKVR